MPKSLFPAADAETRARLDAIGTLSLVNTFDWENHPLGSIDNWVPALRSTVRTMAAAEVPMVILVGEQGFLIYNDAYAAFAGDRHPEIFGLPAEQAWPEIADFNRHKIDLGMRGETLTLMDEELVLDRHGTPEAAWMNLNYSPILGEDGRPVGVLVIVQETTDRVLTEKALARSEERLSLALSGTSMVGTWDWDVVNDVVVADDRFARLFNLDPLRAGLGVEIGSFLEAIHPDDRERVSAEINECLLAASDFRSEYRVVQPDNSIRWVVASGRPRLDADGIAVRFPGVIVDITDQRHIADALADSEARFRTLADTMPQMVWSTRPDGYHDYYNARWYEFTGAPVGSTDGEGWNDMFHPDDRERARTIWRLSLVTGDPYRVEYRLRHSSGQYHWVLGQALPIRNEDGQIIRWFGTCTDIHDSKIVAEEREIVAQELSHRIKNIFSVISGIVSLSARAHPEMKSMADDLRGRIVALGQAHDFVRPHSKSSGPAQKQTSLRALIHVLVDPYDRHGMPRIVFEGPDAEIDDGAATPLALLFHELATNSVKYGALSNATGTVTIASELVDGSYRIDWKEQGGPTKPEGAELPGFGSRLMSLSVEGQLRGSLERLWEESGLHITISLPLESLRRQAGLGATEAKT